MSEYFKTGPQGVNERIVKEGVHYIVIKDGHGYEHKVANLDNLDICPRKGNITVEALKINKRAENRVLITRVRDKITGLIYGIPLGIDPDTKNLMWESIELNDITHFDLKIPKDAHRWTVVSHSNILKGSPNQIAKPLFKVINKEADAEQYKVHRKQRLYAQTIASQLTPNQFKDMGYLLGIDPSLNSPSLLEDYVLKIADHPENYKKFLAAYENKNKATLIIFRKAFSYGLITNHAVDGYYYDRLFLGVTENIVINFLDDNKALLMTIDHRIAELEEQDRKNNMFSEPEEEVKVEKKEKTEENEMPGINDNDIIVMDLQRRLEESEKRNSEMQTALMEKMKESEKTVKKKTEEPDELKRLREKAKLVGLKGWQIMSEESLKKKLQLKGAL